MTKTPSFTDWHKHLATILSKPIGSDTILEVLKSIEKLVDSCNSMSIIYGKNQVPEVSHHRLLANEDYRTQVGNYIEGAYLLDPYYRKAADENTEGLFTLNDVAPKGFEESEYYKLYYHQATLIDEVCFLFKFDEDTIASISICRSNSIHDTPFSAENIAQLESVFPIVKVIFQQWYNDQEKDQNVSIQSHLDNALTNFGSSLLTQKECEILQLILHGNSVKAIAEKLDNSIETIKHHRKKIYVKLDINSQSELFYLFIACLRDAPSSPTLDPLAHYNGDA